MKPTNRSMKRTKGYRSQHDFFTFDIETIGLGGPFADAVVWTKDGGERYSTVDALFDRMLNPPRIVRNNRAKSKAKVTGYAHNMAGYDLCYIISLLAEYAISNGILIHTVSQGTRLIGITIPCDDGDIILQDSYRVIPLSLEKASKSFAPEYAKLSGSIDWEKENYDPCNPVHVEYMMRDGEALYHTIFNYRKLMFDTFGIEPGMTAGSTAIKIFRAQIPEGEVYFRQNPEVEKWLEDAKFGGFCFPGHTYETVHDYVTIDRSAAYATVMRDTPFPVRAGYRTTQFTNDYPGIWEVNVTAPEIPVPIIPAKIDGTKWPLGKFTTKITGEEIEFARRLGYEFEIIDGIIFPECEYIFTDYINKFEELEYSGDAGLKEVVKLHRNAPTGKFATRTSNTELIIGDADDANAIPILDKSTGLPLPYFELETDVDASYIHPEWYIFITSRQRLEMFRVMMEIPSEELGKMDTDSLTMPKYRREILLSDGIITEGKGYGKYHLEHIWDELTMQGPKNYFGFDSLEDKWIDHCKGIPTKELMKARKLERETKVKEPEISFDSVQSPKMMLRTNAAVPAINRTRKIGIPQSVTGWNACAGSFLPLRF